MYASTNFKSKKDFKAAVAEGRKVSIFQPNCMFGNSTPQNGDHCVEGPYGVHKWYASVTVKDGVVVSVK